MIKISHECPLHLLPQSRLWNDYDYALVHLFEKYPTYYNFFVESLKLGRKVILDNSIFELGIAFNTKQYANWITKLEPTEYMVPDSLQNYIQTITNFKNWIKHYSKLPGKMIGVIQGKTYEELVECYKFMSDNADKIAISFDYDYYILTGLGKNKWQKYSNGRVNLVNKLNYDQIWNNKKPHHLLGIATPQETKNYYWDQLNIETLDTSNPIQQGLLGIKYTKNGLEEKNTLKVADSFEATYTSEQIKLAKYNVKKFKEFCYE